MGALANLIADPSTVNDLPSEAVPALRGELALLDTMLLARLLSAPNGQTGHPAPGDRRLSVEEAAVKLNVSKDYLYRNAPTLPFTIRIGRGVGFSEQGIEKWMRRRTAR